MAEPEPDTDFENAAESTCECCRTPLTQAVDTISDIVIGMYDDVDSASEFVNAIAGRIVWTFINSRTKH